MRELRKDAAFLDAEREKVRSHPAAPGGAAPASRHPASPWLYNGFVALVCLEPSHRAVQAAHSDETCYVSSQERGAGKAERRTQRRAGFAMLEQLESDMKSGGQRGLWKKKHKK